MFPDYTIKTNKKLQEISCQILPNNIENSIKQDFHFPEKMVFCEIATQAENRPRVRTVRLYGIEEDKGLVFVTQF